jgi:hypothetical protein
MRETPLAGHRYRSLVSGVTYHTQMTWWADYERRETCIDRKESVPAPTADAQPGNIARTRSRRESEDMNYVQQQRRTHYWLGFDRVEC